MSILKEKVKNRVLVIRRCGSTIISFVAALSAGFTIYKSIFNIDGKVNFWWLGILVVLFLGFSVFTITSFVKYRREAEEAMSIFTDSLHQINHFIRNSLFHLNSITNKDTPKVIISELYFSQLKDAIEIMANTLSNFSKNKVCICVKEIYCTSKDGNENNTFVNTICRSSNTVHYRRRNNNDQKIIENTDFHLILSGEDESFSVPDIKKYKKTHEYKNSSRNWSKHYNSTTVVPIRIENKNLGVENSYKYDIIGFVCADTKAKGVFTEENIDDFTNYVKGCADIFYIHLKQYKSAMELK